MRTKPLTPTVELVVDPHRLFEVYNAARWHLCPGKLDRKRLDRGLGLALSRDFQVGYHNYISTDWACNCPDATYREITCKHVIAIALLAASQ